MPRTNKITSKTTKNASLRASLRASPRVDECVVTRRKMALFVKHWIALRSLSLVFVGVFLDTFGQLVFVCFYD